MRVKTLYLKDFRNISEMMIQPHASTNIIFGDNAQGKTNLLEAIWMFTGNKSFRGSREMDFISFDKKGYYSELTFEDNNEQKKASISVFEDKKQVILNDVKYKTVRPLVGNFYATVFSPAHLSLIKDGPEKRRSFLDSSICQLKPSFQKASNDYSRLLLQRNTLLKDMICHPQLMDTLDIWDQNLSKIGTGLLLSRKNYLETLIPFVEDVYDGICKQKERVKIKYLSSVFEEEYDFNKSPDSIAKDYFERLLIHRKDDRAVCNTSIGPHRDDVEILLDGKNARSFASQGQQRSLVLALKLGETDLIKNMTGKNPIVLLDDVMSELDKNRQEYILNHITAFQVFITCCDKDLFSYLKDGSVFHVQDGRFVRQQEKVNE